MDPIMRVVLPLIGAVVGAGIGSMNSGLFAAVIGAGFGYVLAELGLAHGALRTLGQQLQRLQQRVDRQSDDRQSDVVAERFERDAADVATSVRATPDLPAMSGTAERAAATATPTPADTRESKATLEPRRSDFDEVPGVATLRRFFTGGNALVRAGVIVLFFGVAFLLRYMAEHSHVSITARLTAVAAGGVILLVLGWRLRAQRPGYALALQGAAVGVLYLTIFAAFRLFALVPPGFAFAALVAIAALSAPLAVLQNSQSFALLGAIGGFLAPVLASNGEGSHVALFSYYAVLNSGIVALAWFKAWRLLNLAGFLMTFVVASVWGALKYQPDLFASTEPFLILFFLMYLSVAILFSLRQAPALRGYVDGTLVFGNPLAAFGLQAVLLQHRSTDLAFSALAVSALYLGSAASMRRRRIAGLEQLTEAFIALGVLFLTVAIPLALDERWSGVGWAFEGTALVWIGIRQDRVLARICGALLNVAAGWFVGREFGLGSSSWWPAPGGLFAIVAMSVAAIGSACWYKRAGEGLRPFELGLPSLLYVYGSIWWLLAGLAELDRYLPQIFAAATLGFFALNALMSSEVARRTSLGAAKVVALVLLPVLICYAVSAAYDGTHPFARFGWAAWPAAVASWYSIMHRHEGDPGARLAKLLQTGSMWLLCAVAGWEFAWSVERWVNGGADWPLAAMVLPSVALLLALPRLVTRIAWPFARHREVMLFVVGVGVALALGVWSVGTSLFDSGETRPLQYMPLLNPVDLMQAGVVLGLLGYARFLRAVHAARVARLDPRLPVPAITALAFVWLNAMLLRTVHHWGAIPYHLEAMFASTLVQTSVSIFWAVVALSAMLLAGRRMSRPIWIAGAALMGVVIGKLFLIDLSRVGSVERIVSFLGVGGLMLIVGYLSPLPPAAAELES